MRMMVDQVNANALVYLLDEKLISGSCPLLVFGDPKFSQEKTETLREGNSRLKNQRLEKDDPRLGNFQQNF